MLVDLYWNLNRSKTDSGRKMKILVNLIANEDDEEYFENKTGLSIRRKVDGSTEFYSLSHFSEKNDKWLQHNLIDMLLNAKSVTQKFEPLSFVGRARQ